MVNNFESDPTTLTWLGNTATISVNNPDASYRSYNLSTTLDLRDSLPESRQISFSELSRHITLRTGDLMFDGLFALAMEEARQNSVDSITNGAFNDGNPISCVCYETGRKWTYVWTRDAAYSVDLALALIDPIRSRNSLEFKLSERRVGGNPEIVQDTGSGGSWPVSTDRVVWAMGAWELLKYLDGTERTQFREKAYEAIVNTIENDRTIIFDSRDRLYRGEQSFLDWREQTYASWTKEDTVHIGMSKALSTNLNHYAILRVADSLAEEKGESTAQARYDGWADELRTAINQNFWLSSEGLYSSLKYTELDQTILKKFDLLGESLAVILGVADESKAASIMENYPHTIAGPPVIWPQQPLIPIYHNRSIWPFVTSYVLRAARKAKNDTAVNHNVLSLMRGAALNLSNMENFEFLTLANWYDDGIYSGPVINSQRQLWSVAGYLSMVLDVVFGRETTQDGIRFHPFLTKQLRNSLFKDSANIRLNNLPYKEKIFHIELILPPADSQMGGYYEVSSVSLNGSSISSDEFLSAGMLNAENQLVIQIVDAAASMNSITVVEDDGEFRLFWAPKEPRLNSISIDGGLLRLHYDSNGENNVVFNIYRNGKLVASDLTETSWVDLDSGNHASETYCYALAMRYIGFDNVSHHSKPQCYWSSGTIEEINVPDSRLVSNNSASTEFNHGREHFNDWGYPGEELEITTYTPGRTGLHYIQLVYGNKMGPVNTGITASVKWIEVIDNAIGEVVSSGAVFMPHLKDWDIWGDSSFLSVSLDAGRSYRIRISDAYNMSYLKHFQVYSGQGGKLGPNNRVNISGVKFLAMTNPED